MSAELPEARDFSRDVAHDLVPDATPGFAPDFDPVTAEQWHAVAEAVLARSGQHLGDLNSHTPEGITVHPLYSAADEPDVDTGVPGQPPFVRGALAVQARPGAGALAGGGWGVRPLHANPDAAAANAAILADLNAGASSLWLRDIAPDDLPVALAGVRLDIAPVALDAGAQTLAAARVLLGLAAVQEPMTQGETAPGGSPGDARGQGLAEAGGASGQAGGLGGTLGADPVGLALLRGGTPDYTLLGELAGLLAPGAHPRLALATVDATVLHEAGATDAQELAYATAAGVAYLRALTAAGLSTGQALARMEFRFAVTDAQFASMAKLRAARRMWSRVAELSLAQPGAAAGAGPADAQPGAAAGAGPVRGQRQHAVTSAAMLTQRDPWVNLLRSAIACFAAATAGAEAITVLPFDHALGLPDADSRRLARNTQIILSDEVNLGRVADPGGGSYYLESLTDSLAQVAWDQFTAIEAAGGIDAVLASGALASQVAAARAAREREVAERREPITGVSEFPLLTEQSVHRAPGAQPSGSGPASAATASAAPGAPFAPHRYAEQFEALRARSDAHLAASGARPVVLLAAPGTRGQASGRIDFASNLFHAAGIETSLALGSVQEIVARYQGNPTPVVCLCSTDAVYAEQAAPVAAALKAAGAGHVLLAGQPGERRASDEKAGIESYIYLGVNAIDVLERTFTQLGVPA